MAIVHCARCGQDRNGMAFQPFGNDIGKRAFEQICGNCWADWLKMQQQLINHYGLNVMDPQARNFLKQNMQAFLFKTGAGEDVDTSKKGTIEW